MTTWIYSVGNLVLHPPLPPHLLRFLSTQLFSASASSLVRGHTIQLRGKQEPTPALSLPNNIAQKKRTYDHKKWKASFPRAAFSCLSSDG